MVDKWEKVWSAMSLGLEGLGAESAHGLCMNSPLLICLQKLRNGNCERGCAGGSILEKSSKSG